MRNCEHGKFIDPPPPQIKYEFLIVSFHNSIRSFFLIHWLFVIALNSSGDRREKKVILYHSLIVFLINEYLSHHWYELIEVNCITCINNIILNGNKMFNNWLLVPPISNFQPLIQVWTIYANQQVIVYIFEETFGDDDFICIDQLLIYDR